MNASFSEKSVWVQFIGMALGLGAYFLIASNMMRAGVDVLAAYMPLLIAAVVLMVVIQVAGHIWAAISSRGHEVDERDQLIAWRAESRASWIVASGAVMAIGALVVAAEPLWIAHGLLFSLFLSELVKYALQLNDYRRGW